MNDSLVNFDDQPINNVVLSNDEIAGSAGVDNGSAFLHDVKGLTAAEYNDPNKINVEIIDKKTPIVVLFGPPACGKTMSLIRLTKYLTDIGYTVEPERTFRPCDDTHYQSMCDNYNNMVANNNAAKSTDLISFMLVKVYAPYPNPKCICQILEAPGELYFHPQHQMGFPSYFNTINNADNRKVWCIMVEPDWLGGAERSGYVTRIRELKQNTGLKDKFVFVFNKIDKTGLAMGQGRVNVKLAQEKVGQLYDNIFVPFRTKGIFGMNDNYKFVPFQTGDFPRAFDGTVSFQPGPAVYPQMLWKAICDSIAGK